MSALEDIRAAATAARGTIDTAITHAASALHEAQTKAQQLTALGLTGVVAVVHSAQQALELAASNLNTACLAADGAVNALSQITDDASTEETIHHLDAVVGQLDQATTGINAAASEVQQAESHAQQAQIDHLTGVITSLRETLAAARQSIDSGSDRTQTYRQQVEAVRQGN